jgi:uncharacterized membrane protein
VAERFLTDVKRFFLDHEDTLTVFVPSSPTPMTGNIITVRHDKPLPAPQEEVVA